LARARRTASAGGGSLPLPDAHAAVNHAETFVNGNVHVVGVESFWSLFKRAIIGVCQRVSAKYIQAYLNAFVFRFNNRHNRSIFKAVLANC
jgi:hypothetical protein